MAFEGVDPHEIANESVTMSVLTISQIMHPAYGEIVSIKESSDSEDGSIKPAEKLKILEMAKIFIVQEILEVTGTIG